MRLEIVYEDRRILSEDVDRVRLEQDAHGRIELTASAVPTNDNLFLLPTGTRLVVTGTDDDGNPTSFGLTEN